MRLKQWKIFPLAFWTLALVSCQSSGVINYTDDTPLRLDLNAEKLTILQLTDLHLTFGIDANDRRTFQLIEALVEESSPDLVVFTGDITMAPYGPQLFNRLARVMEGLDVYWTFIFGNHDNDHARYEEYLQLLPDYEKLLFKVGPEIVDGGLGNFTIMTYYNNLPFYQLYMFDTHTEVPGELEYGWLSDGQVAWYDTHAANDAVSGIKSSVFMHIPLIEYDQFDESAKLDGVKGEGIYHQGVNTGLFQKLVDHGVSQAVFAGHDHLNNFSFLFQGIRLAYGVASGYNGYGDIEKGGRVIEIDSTKALTTRLVTGSEVGV